MMMRWLIPRLPEFKSKHQPIELRLNISYGDTDFIRDEISIAIRNTIHRPPAAAIAETVIREEIGPVCHPDYAARHNLTQIDDLLGGRILLNETRPNAWSEWAGAAGRPDLRLAHHESYGHFYLVIQAAACGLGLAMAPLILVEDEIRSGHLVAPFGFVGGPHEIQLWMAGHQRGRADLQATAEWLRTQLRAVSARV